MKIFFTKLFSHISSLVSKIKYFSGLQSALLDSHHLYVKCAFEIMSSFKKIGEISKASGKVALEWKIDNFFSYTEKNSEYFSSEFSILNLTWQISVRPNGKASDNSTGWVSLFLYRVDNGVSKSIDFSFGIKSKKQFIVNKGETTWQSDNEGWGWPMFIEKSTLKQWKENVVPSGNLTIICSIIVKDEPEFDIEESEYKVLNVLKLLKCVLL